MCKETIIMSEQIILLKFESKISLEKNFLKYICWQEKLFLGQKKREYRYRSRELFF